MHENILFILYAIIYKLTDDFYDEEIYNLYFPYGKLVIFPIVFIYTLYLFYCRDYNSTVFLFLFCFEFCYICCLLLRYLNSFLTCLGEMNLSIYDPFTLLTFLKLPMFIYKFYDTFVLNFNIIFTFILFAFFIGMIHDIDNSLLGIYILNNKYNGKNKRENKIIYRLVLSFLFYLSLLYKDFKNKVIKSSIIFSIAYFMTSVFSLIVQIILENNNENEKITKEIYFLINKSQSHLYKNT